MITVNHPLRHPLQALVSLGQIYGDILYYATCMFDHYHKNLTYCRPEAYYFWCYFFFMNFIWIVIPGGGFCNHFCLLGSADHQTALLYQSIQATSEAFSALHQKSDTRQANGSAKKPGTNGHLKSS
jgi:EXPERA (EXPanded EBP superfamily)